MSMVIAAIKPCFSYFCSFFPFLLNFNCNSSTKLMKTPQIGCVSRSVML